MSLISPNTNVYARGAAKNTHPSKKQGEHLSPGWRAEKIVVAPLAGIGTGLSSGVKATFATTAAAGTLAMTSHPLLAATVGLGGFIAVPLYAASKAIGQFFSNLKAGITGHTAPKG